MTQNTYAKWCRNVCVYVYISPLTPPWTLPEDFCDPNPTFLSTVKGTHDFIILLKTLSKDLHIFTVKLILPVYFLILCSLLPASCDLPESALLCCKLILQRCKSLCTQKLLDTRQIPFNNPGWGTTSWRPWSLLAFSEKIFIAWEISLCKADKFFLTLWMLWIYIMDVSPIKPHW